VSSYTATFKGVLLVSVNSNYLIPYIVKNQVYEPPEDRTQDPQIKRLVNLLFLLPGPILGHIDPNFSWLNISALKYLNNKGCLIPYSITNYRY
jgi:hypothetical protein